MKPAIEGGAPVREKFLVFGKPKIHAREINEVVATIQSGWLGTGPKTKRFEEHFRAFIGSRHAIALNSCTAGLHLSLDVLGVHDGDEVITTPLTFPSTANVIVHHHAQPVFVDIERDSWNIDSDNIERAITKKTRAIITVDLHGRPCNYRAIKRIAKKHKLYLIEDAAHAAEAVYRGKKIGTLADFTAFSFYVTKNIMTGEGGMLTTAKDTWANEARIRSLHGISKDAWKRYSNDGVSQYETLYPGYKYNMTDIQASFGIHQLSEVAKNHAVRARHWQLYSQQLADVAQIELPAPIEPDTIHAYHLYAILLKPKQLSITRDQFIAALKAENIGTGIHFTALHLHKFYRETYGFARGDFPNAEYFSDRTVSLPLTAGMTQQDIADVVAAVKKLIAFYKK